MLPGVIGSLSHLTVTRSRAVHIVLALLIAYVVLVSFISFQELVNAIFDRIGPFSLIVSSHGGHEFTNLSARRGNFTQASTGMIIREPNTYYEFSKAYQKTFGENPHGYFRLWFRKALEHHCRRHPAHFIDVKRDLGRFRRSGGKISKSDVKKAIESIAPYSRLVVLGTHAHYNHIYPQANTILEQAKREVHIVQNDWDEPVLLLESDSFTTLRLPNKLYSSPQEAYQSNGCLSQKMSHLKPNTPFFTFPTSFPSTNVSVPFFSTAKLPHCYGDIIIASERNGARVANEKLREANITVTDNWSSKQNRVFWRGSNTGGLVDTATYPLERYPRFRLVDWAKHTPLRERIEIDVAINGLPIQPTGANADAIREEMKNKYPVKEGFVPLGVQFQSKYLIVIDGNTWPDRLTTFLHSGSVVLLATVFVDWVTLQLVPWVHYVPVNIDLSDLNEHITWLIENDKEAERIAKNGQAFAKNHLRIVDMEIFNSFVALQYSQIFDENL